MAMLQNNFSGPSAMEPVDSLKKLVWKNNGVLFESDLVQIGVKCEYRSNLGRMTLFYGNKTPLPMLSFNPSISCGGELASKISIQVKPVDTVVEAGAQVQQMINIECIDDFVDYPSLVVTFVYNNTQQKLNLKLPLTINKFFEATDMDGETFFARWKNLGGALQETQKIFKATHPMDTSATAAKLSGFGMQLLNGIDPNPDNFVCAAILHTKLMQIGCLLRLEPNKQAQMYRLTVRASKESVSKQTVELLGDYF